MLQASQQAGDTVWTREPSNQVENYPSWREAAENAINVLAAVAIKPHAGRPGQRWGFLIHGPLDHREGVNALNLLLENNFRTGSRLLELKEQRHDRAPILRLPLCQNKFERLGLDSERAGTACLGCRYKLDEGCPNTRAWTLDRSSGVKPVCRAEDLVYCKHYDCGCDRCANYLLGTPMPVVSRG